jgi:small subunit ribosomal protein S2
MTEPTRQHILWREPLSGRLTDQEISYIERELDVSMPWYFNPAEWVVGYRILEATEAGAILLRVVRMADATGIVFELVSSAASFDEGDLPLPLRRKVTRLAQALAQAQGPVGPRQTGRRASVESAEPVVSLSQLIAAGMHFGHQRSRWNPKMRSFIAGQKNGSHIIDIRQSLPRIDTAYEFLRRTVADGGEVLFVGTKPQVRQTISRTATRVGMPHVTTRWLGGTLTNFDTISMRVERLEALDEGAHESWPLAATKKERLLLERERSKLARSFSGIRTMNRLPDALWIVDTPREHLAVREARKLGIPIVALADTNSDPDDIDYPIPGNDDAARTTTLMTRVMADAVAEGLMARAASSVPPTRPKDRSSRVYEGAPVDLAVTPEPTLRTRPERQARPRVHVALQGPPPATAQAPPWAATREAVRQARIAADLHALASALVAFAIDLWRSSLLDESLDSLHEAIGIYKDTLVPADPVRYEVQLDVALRLTASVRGARESEQAEGGLE